MKILLLTLFLMSPFWIFGQRETSLGLDFTLESSSDEEGTFAGFGAVGDFRFTKHSGLETGIFLRNNRTRLNIFTPGNSWTVTVAERYLSIPVLYKYHSRIVNLSAGPTLDIFMGWKQKEEKQVVVNSYSVDPELSFGIMGKLSKRINLSSRFIVEPEIRLNIIQTAGRNILGAGIAGKYILKHK